MLKQTVDKCRRESIWNKMSEKYLSKDLPSDESFIRLELILRMRLSCKILYWASFSGGPLFCLVGRLHAKKIQFLFSVIKYFFESFDASKLIH